MLLPLVRMPIAIPLYVLKLGCSPFRKATPRFYYSDCLSFEHRYTSESSGVKGGGGMTYSLYYYKWSPSYRADRL
jgi:hypothetical protein